MIFYLDFFPLIMHFIQLFSRWNLNRRSSIDRLSNKFKENARYRFSSTQQVVSKEGTGNVAGK